MVMIETLDEFQGGLQIKGQIVRNHHYVDDIIMFATLEAELQELMDHLDRVNRKYSLLFNVDKTKVMASDGTAWHILIQNEQLEQVDTFPYIGSLITENGECKTEFHTSLNGGRQSAHPAENMAKSQHTNFNKDTTDVSTSLACSNIRQWKLGTQKESRNMSWCLWDERNEKDSVSFVDSKENKRVGP